MPENLSNSSSKRLSALDALRGLSIAAMFIVGSKSPFLQFRHVDWFGYHAADLVYPIFLFVLGFSMFLSTSAKDKRGIPPGEQTRSMIKRLSILFIIGLFLRSVSYSRPYFNLGTLQCIALSALGAYPFVRSSAKGKLIGIFVIYAVMLLSHTLLRPAGTPWDLRWTEGYTSAEWLDSLLISEPRGPEGTLSTFAAIPFILFGQLAAVIYFRLGASVLYVRRLLLMAAGLMILGYTLGASVFSQSALFIPLSPQVMTPSYSLVSTAWSLGIFAFLIYIMECRPWGRLMHPLVVLGSNAIAVFVVVKLSRKWIFATWTITLGDAQYTLAQTAELFTGQGFGLEYAQLAQVAYKLGAALVVAYFLWWRKIFFRL